MSKDPPAEIWLESVATPALLVDEARMIRNIVRLKMRLRQLGVAFRPHLKTAKNIEIARCLMTSPRGPAAVSTLKEAEEFASAGIRDLLYAVGIAARKLDRVVALRSQGHDVTVILDSMEQARAIAAKSRECGRPIPALIEIDCDGERAGIEPGHPSLIEVGRALHQGGAELRGVMTHAGGSYRTPGAEALAQAAENERSAIVQSAQELRAAGLPCPLVSVGSTPTAHFARNLAGVSEVRAGVFVFCDLVMASLGVCAIDDIALSVLATVIGHQIKRDTIIVDAGWTAMSQDRGRPDASGYHAFGLVCDIEGRPYDDLVMSRMNQEHGILAIREGSQARCPRLPIGTLVRILPNHACATAEQHRRYFVLRGGRVTAQLPRIVGW
jgi:D-serine deaminase-like pyridoxal phosphate-dependent protein